LRNGGLNREALVRGHWTSVLARADEVIE
jgi:hypothetical protein